MHTRWDKEHTDTCLECYNEWLDEVREMQLEIEMEAVNEC